MSYNKAAQMAYARSQIGFHEVPDGSNNQPWTAWQFDGSLRNLSWCASFQNYCADQAGGFRWPAWLHCQCGWKGDAYVPYTVMHAKAFGLWRSPNTMARQGWVSVFSWNRNGNADHQETVDYDTGQRFTTIGGNTSNGVYARLRDRTFLMGFVALDEAGQTAPGSDPGPAPPAPPIVQPDEEIPEEGIMFTRPGARDPNRPHTCEVLAHTLFTFNTDTNPFHDASGRPVGTLRPFGKGHFLDFLPDAETVQGIDVGAYVNDNHHIRVGSLLTDGTIGFHDLFW